MLVLLDNSKDLTTCEAEIGRPVGQLLTPLTRYRNRAAEEGRPWAMDNGAFSQFRKSAFMALMQREIANATSCLFVACPDVVGCHDRTLDLFGVWHVRVAPYPPAFVAQDGCDRIPEEARALFVGGSTEFKQSPEALLLAKDARARGLWVHVGRVNSQDRYNRWVPYADSCDGSGISQYSWQRRELATGTPLLDHLEEAPDGQG